MPRAYRPTAPPVCLSSLLSCLSFFFVLERNCGFRRYDRSVSERFHRAWARYDPCLSEDFRKIYISYVLILVKSTWNSQNHNLSGARIIVVRSFASSSISFFFFFFGESTRMHGIEQRMPRASNTAERFVGAIVRAKHSLAMSPCVVATPRQTVTYRLMLNYHRQFF